MVYETSYESGRRPFKPDLQRGKWEKPTDFIYACFGLGLKLDIFTASFWFFFDMGLSGMMPYYLYMVVYLVPLMVIQSFMGQFASSGYISVFRLSPLFKGMGYVSLALSISVLTYYSLFAAIPLIFIINSLRPTMPWSCEAVKHWDSMTAETICNTTNKDEENIEFNATEYIATRMIRVPSVMYFQKQFNNISLYEYDETEYKLSWSVLGTTILVWAFVAYIFYQFSDATKFGKMLRYLVCTTLALLLVCFLRFLWLPGAVTGITQYVTPDVDQLLRGAIIVPIFSMQAFGAGWGTIIALSSYNKFNTNIMKYSWLIAFGQMLIFITFGMVTFMLSNHFVELTSEKYEAFVETHWVLFLSSASALASLHWANLWTFVYYTMLLLATLIVLITQIFTILTSLFDEFEALREHRQLATFGLIGLAAFSSFFFCSNHGILYFSSLSLSSMATQVVLHLLVMLLVLWVYGRVRFQRDIEFMLGQPFASWKIFILRYIAPVLLLITLMNCLLVAYMEHMYFSSTAISIISIMLTIVPLLVIPGYGTYTVLQGLGSFGMRLRRACRPTDWFPVEAEDRQRYEEAMGTTDITHQLYEITEEVN